MEDHYPTTKPKGGIAMRGYLAVLLVAIAIVAVGALPLLYIITTPILNVIKMLETLVK